MPPLEQASGADRRGGLLSEVAMTDDAVDSVI